MASRAIDGVEMPGARVHNEILGQFHASLSQDEVCTPFSAPSPLSQSTPVPLFSLVRQCKDRALHGASSSTDFVNF